MSWFNTCDIFFISKDNELAKKNGYYYGHTSNYLEVCFKKDSKVKINEYCKVVITEIGYPICRGEMK